MQGSEISVPNWQVFERMGFLFKDHTVGWAVHRFQAELITLRIMARPQHKHVVFVVGVVARALPQIKVVQVRCDYFLVPSFDVFISEHLLKFGIDLGTCWLEEHAAR